MPQNDLNSNDLMLLIHNSAKKAVAYIPCTNLLLCSDDCALLQDERNFSRIGNVMGNYESRDGFDLL